jgi:RNA polymerase sigma-70 factor (ECF subfamily)
MEDDTDGVDHAVELLRVYDDASVDVFRYLHARCGNRSVAEDLTSETFLAAVSQVNRARVDRVTVAWLIGIARHKLIDHWRRAERRPKTTVLHETTVNQDAIETMNGEEAWDQLLDRHQVGAVMRELGAHHRSALVLRYFDGLSVPDVADHLGRTVQATETLLVRARRTFRTLYERDEAGAS